MNTINPTAGFSAHDIIKKFHWLIENGFTVEKAAQTIKGQTTVKSVIEYVDNYLKSRKK
jgi:hypothetical protein